MPNYLEYQISVGKEFEALKNRVRNIIDDAHWGEDGRYKEVLLMNYLKRMLPRNLSVGTGFVKGNDEITTQIDIIIYDNSYPCFFQEGDFVIVIPESVIGIIEVKTNIKSDDIFEIIDKANKNGERILRNDTATRRERELFNGIFAYEKQNKIESYMSNISNTKKLTERDSKGCYWNDKGFVNNICLGNNFFIKYWGSEECKDYKEYDKCYYAYEFKDETKNLDGLALSWFLSYLLHHTCFYDKKSNKTITTEYWRYLFPLSKDLSEYEVCKVSVGDNIRSKDDIFTEKKQLLKLAGLDK